MEAVTDALNQHFAGKEPSRITFEVSAALLSIFAAGQLIYNREEVKHTVLETLFSGIKALPVVQDMLAKEKAGLKKQLVKSMELGGHLHTEVPLQGTSSEEILTLLRDLAKREEHHLTSGKISGALYSSDKKLSELLSQVYALFSSSNALHPTIFPSVRKFEAEIVRMTVSMMNGDEEACGALTSGGTESILMAVKAHRDYYKKQNPEIIVPVTGHAAFDKAASYFKIKLVHAPLGPDYKVDVNAVRRLINRNTILIVGSAPGFPHGVIDPIEELAALAHQNNVGFHADCCLGGFLLPWVRKAGIVEVPPFDFSVKGVTSISADTHKYGYATKGTSVVMFKTHALRRSMYFVAPNWPGGMYASPTIAGSRPGALIACCWAALIYNGQHAYKEKSVAIWKTAQLVKDGIRKMPELTLIGDSYSSVVAFGAATSALNIFKVADAMNEKGWHLNNLQRPSCVHICLTNHHVGRANDFIGDLEDGVRIVMENPDAFPNGTAGVYGMAAALPDRSMVADIGVSYLDGCLDVF